MTRPTAPTTNPTVWTDRAFEPLGEFHAIVGRKTACGVPVIGHGYVVQLRQARSDARQPCSVCYVGGGL